MSIEEIQLQYDRLDRHYKAALNDYDQISLLDLSQALRVWEELKHKVRKLTARGVEESVFLSGSASKSFSSNLRMYQYVSCYLPGAPVRSYAGNGSAFAGPEPSYPELATSIEFTSGKMKWAQEYIELRSAFFVYGYKDLKKVIKVYEGKRLALNFSDWMGAEVARLNKKDSVDYKYKLTNFTRLHIIKQVANQFGASHPLDESEGGPENRFYQPTKELMSYKVAGLPIPYFILLKTAADILENIPKLIHGIRVSKL